MKEVAVLGTGLLGAGFAEDVGVELEKASAAALLHPLVAIKFRDAEPLDRALERVGLGADEAANRRCHLGAQRDLAPALVGETKKLRLDFVARLGLVEFERLEHGRIVFREAEVAGGLPPKAEDVVPPRQVLGIELTEAGKGLKRSHEGTSVAKRSASRRHQKFFRLSLSASGAA